MSEFNLGENVEIICSGEQCLVVGVASYLSGDPQCLLRYKNGLGVAVEQWWNIGALKKIAL